MSRAVQSRTLKTRAKLLAAATAIISDGGYEAMRVEEVVLRAGVAKGTFFAHFKDKDALMDHLIGVEIDRHLDMLEQLPSPRSVSEMVEALMPLTAFMSCERYVFDVILRHSGAAAKSEIGAIAMTFGRHAEVIAKWLSARPFRKDISAELQAEGVQAFMIQAVSLMFCSLHNATTPRDRMETYLAAWLVPQIEA
ncbi:TetR/AcrR family transcriptional regulator [Shimia sp. R10_1]|uniref:TetR/AcrR family transcriptional regulator n=1 Tax=Shimia sp. R10_1 TaxID=2821095 RepID=UPI001ADCA35C|nr:TetR/AcrR family transcriptional regulator [Shimia sp. R10_1]MBO9473066.1 TetR/AcrR family transcriptional regulator [Shimia sp. R10_1]